MNKKINVNKQVGDKLREARLAKKLTQQELAKLTYISQPSINKIENGIHGVSVEKLITFSKVLDREIIYFLSDFK